MPEWIMPWFVFEMLGEHLGLVCREGRREPKQFWKQGANRTDRRTCKLCCDHVEERTLMSVIPGYDYVLYEPLAVSFSSGGPKAAIAPRGIYDDVGVFQTVS